MKQTERKNINEKNGFPRVAGVVIGLSCWLILIHWAKISIWGPFYSWQFCQPEAESAFCFSAVTYTTVNYGDLVLPQSWRMLAPLKALTGILVCGLSGGHFFVLIHLQTSRCVQWRTASELAARAAS